jgi:hypothetical protein
MTLYCPKPGSSLKPRFWRSVQSLTSNPTLSGNHTRLSPCVVEHFEDAKLEDPLEFTYNFRLGRVIQRHTASRGIFVAVPGSCDWSDCDRSQR